MAYAVVQKAQADDSVSSATQSLAFSTQNVTLGNRIIVAAQSLGGTAADNTSTCTDNLGNTYNQHDFVSAGGNGPFSAVFSLVVPANIAGTKPTITVNWKAAGVADTTLGNHLIDLAEVSGLNATNGSGALDGVFAHSFGNTGTSPASVTMGSTSGSSGEFVFCAFQDWGPNFTITKAASYTQDINNSPSGNLQGCVEHKDSTSGVSELGTWTWASGTDVFTIQIGVFKLASATTASGADSIAVTNAATKLALATANDPVVITDAATKLALAAPNDSLVISESASVGGGNTPTGADSIAVTDAPTQIGLSPSDSLAVTDAGSNVMLAAADSIAVTDAASGLSPAVTDAIALTDAPTQIDLTPGASIPGTQGGGSAYAQTPYASTPYAGASTSTPSSPGGGTESITVFEAGVPSTSTFVSASDAITIADAGAVIVGAFIVMPTLAVLEVMPVNSVTLEAMPVTVAVLEVSPAK